MAFTNIGNPTSAILTGYISAAGTVASSDSVLQAIQKLNGNYVAGLNAARPAFLAKVNALLDNVTGDNTTYSFAANIWTEIKDQNNNFDNGIFTAPVTGLYQFVFNLSTWYLEAAHTYGYLLLVTSNRNYPLFEGKIGALSQSSYVGITFTENCDLDINDTAYVTLSVNGSTKTVDITANTYFSGFLVC